VVQQPTMHAIMRPVGLFIVLDSVQHTL